MFVLLCFEEQIEVEIDSLTALGEILLTAQDVIFAVLFSFFASRLSVLRVFATVGWPV